MSRIVSVKAYDGTVVRIPENKVKEFLLRQEKIKELIKKGESTKDVLRLLKEAALQ